MYIEITMAKEEDTALHIAIRHHQIHVAVQLIKLGANICAKNSRGETPLQLAVVNKSHVDLLTEMIPNGTRYSQMNFDRGLTSLRMAIANRDEDTVRELATQDAFNGVDHNLVKMLLDAGADINSRDINGCSALQCAVYTGDVELVKSLIDAGADLNNRNSIGATALHDAVVCCQEAMVLLLLNRGADVAAKILQTEETALHWATLINRNNSHGLIIRYLLEFGSDVNEKSDAAISFNRTPFIYVLMHGDIDLVNLCIDQHKADVNKLTMDGSSPLAFALYNEDRSVRDLVLTEGGTNGMIAGALNYASKLHRPEYVRELIARGADVNSKNKWRLTPFTASIIECWEEQPVDRPNLAEETRQVMKLLLESGADVNQKFDNKLILQLAIESEFFEIRNVAPRLIIEHTVMVETRTNKRVFDDCTLAVINRDPITKAHYHDCQVELTDMRNSKIKGTTITYFFVLMEPLEVVAWYARDEEFSEAFRASDYQSAYPTYAWWLREKFDAASPAPIRQKMIEQVSYTSTNTLSSTTQCVLS